MDSYKVHQSGCSRSVHPGVGATPMAWGGFTSPGGGSRLRRDRLVKWLEETFYEVINQPIHLKKFTRLYRSMYNDRVAPFTRGAVGSRHSIYVTHCPLTTLFNTGHTGSSLTAGTRDNAGLNAENRCPAETRCDSGAFHGANLEGSGPLLVSSCHMSGRRTERHVRKPKERRRRIGTS
jgi:hypothetical protein